MPAIKRQTLQGLQRLLMYLYVSLCRKDEGGRLVFAFHYWCLWIAQSLSAYIEGFGCAELEEEVYADGKVVGVVGDVEPQEFLFFFLFFIVEEGEDETTVGYVVVGFELFFSFI